MSCRRTGILYRPVTRSPGSENVDYKLSRPRRSLITAPLICPQEIIGDNKEMVIEVTSVNVQ